MGKRSDILLSKRTVDGCLPSDKRYKVWDSELPGFGVRVQPSGVKTFVVQYRPGGGSSGIQRMMTLGRFGPLTAEKARRRAKVILGSAAAGSDPGGELMAKRREMKMSDLIDHYEKVGCFIQRGKLQGVPMKPRTKKLTMARLRHHVVPLLGKKRISEIGAGDIEKFFNDVTEGKTASDEKTGFRTRVIVRGGAGAARKVFRDLSAVLSFAKRHEMIERNPCENAAVRKTDNSEARFLTLDELTRLGAALDEVEAEGANPKAINIARLWALTGCRHQEIASLKWSEVNIEEGLLELDDSKTGKSVRPLGVAAQTLLARLAKEKAKDTDKKKSEYVFPAERGERHFQGTTTHWSKAIKKAKLPGVTPHTLRHTVGSTATSTGEALALTGAILGHANPRSTAIYAHVQRDPSRRAANRVSKKIAAALAGELDSKGRNAKKQKHDHEISGKALVRLLKQQLAKRGPEAGRIRAALVKAGAS
jgi:integrase